MVQPFNSFRHILCHIDELASHCRGQVEHLYTFGLKPDFSQQALEPLDPASCICITNLVMAVSGQSTCHHHAVCAFLQAVQHQQWIQHCAGQHDLMAVYCMRSGSPGRLPHKRSVRSRKPEFDNQMIPSP
jgi:hypothetical protein